MMDICILRHFLCTEPGALCSESVNTTLMLIFFFLLAGRGVEGRQPLISMKYHRKRDAGNLIFYILFITPQLRFHDFE